MHRKLVWGGDKSVTSIPNWESLWTLAPKNRYPDLVRYWIWSWKKFTVPKSWTMKLLFRESWYLGSFFLSRQGAVLFFSLVILYCFNLFVNIVRKTWKRSLLSIFGVWSPMRNSMHLGSVLKMHTQWNNLSSGSHKFSKIKKCKYVHIQEKPRILNNWEKFHQLILVKSLPLNFF